MPDIGPAQRPSQSSRSMRLAFYVLLACVDALSIIAGFAFGGWLRLGTVFAPQVAALVLVTLPLYALTAKLAFEARVLADWSCGVRQAIRALLVALALVLMIGFATHTGSALSRLVMAIGLVVATMSLTVGRYAIGRLAQRVFDGKPMVWLFIDDVGTTRVPRNYHRIDSRMLGAAPSLADPMFMDRLAQLATGADLVTVACPPERRWVWSMALRGCDVRANIVVPELGQLGGVGIAHVGEMPTVLVSVGGLSTHERLIKRLLDLVLVIPTLVFFAPLMFFAAVAIKLDSPGPVFFRQPRVGLGNRIFTVLKFRSMRVAHCDAHGAQSTQRDDERITRVGRWLRMTSVDELPQLFNILAGTMSFVGPRPHALGSLAGNRLFWDIDPRYWHRHTSKPGLTGLAQVRGLRGATREARDLERRLQADLEYVNGWSLWRDMGILLATLRVVIHRNAY